MIARLAISMLMLVLAVGVRADGVVTLRPVARLAGDAPVTLGDIAALAGDAEDLAGLVLVDSPLVEAGADRRLTIELEAVRATIRSHRANAMSRLTIRGEACVVILRPATPLQPTAVSAGPAAPTTVGATLRDHVEAKLLQIMAVERDRMELGFDDRDAALLAIPTAGWTVDVRATGSSGSMPLRITMYDAAGNIRDETLRVGVRILRDVVRTTRALRRGAIVQPGDVTADQEWLEPDVVHVEPMASSGFLLKRHIGAGELLTAGHVRASEIVRKGDIVSVHVVSGTFVIRTPARAMASGGVGEQVEFEPIDGGGRFTAEVKAPGRAVVLTRGDER